MCMYVYVCVCVMCKQLKNIMSSDAPSSARGKTIYRMIFST